MRVRGFRLALLLTFCTNSRLWGDDQERVRILVGALQSLDASVREQACMSLSAIGSAAGDALPALTTTSTKDADPNVREQAVKALGKLIATNDSALAAVIESLHEPSRAIRSAAMSALSEPESPPESAVAAVSEAFLKDHNPFFRDTVFVWFEKFDSPPIMAFPSLMDALKSGDPGVQFRAARRAYQFFNLTPEQSAELKRSLQGIVDDGMKPDTTQNVFLTIQAIRAFEKADDPRERDVIFLTRKAADPDEDVRYNALAVLAIFRASEAAQKQLIKSALRDPDFRVRKFAVTSIDATKDPEAGPALESALSDSVGAVRASALDAISKNDELRSFLCPSVLKVTGDPVTSIRAAAFAALGECPASTATATLVAGVFDPASSIRTASITSLTKLYSSPKNSSGLMAALLGSARENGRPGKWQSLVPIPDSVVAAILKACTDRERGVVKQASAALVEFAPLDSKYLPRIAALATFDSLHQCTQDCKIAALQVLGSFGSEASGFVPQLLQTLQAMNGGTFDWGGYGGFDGSRENLIETLSMIAPYSPQRTDVVEAFIKASSDRSSLSKTALNSISRMTGSIKDPLPFVRLLAEATILDDETENARNSLLSRTPDISAMLNKLIEENQIKEKSAKPLDKVGIFEDHPTYTIRRLKALLGKLAIPRSGTLRVLDKDGKSQNLVADDHNFIIAMGSWCPHSEMLALLLSNERFKRLIGDVRFNFVFVDEWPVAEEQLKAEVEGGNLTTAEAHERLAAAKRSASGSQVIFPKFLEDLPGKVWFISKKNDHTEIPSFPRVFDPAHGKFSRSQDALVSGELLIPAWITSNITW
jgi:HEAT repeat protein